MKISSLRNSPAVKTNGGATTETDFSVERSETVNPSDSLELLCRYQEQYLTRGAHIEQVLLGLLTVGVAGWAFLHAREKGPSDGTALFGRLIFTTIFSMLIAASYNMVYIMMMSTDITVLNLENRLSSTVVPYRDYYSELGSLRYDLYLITGLIVPLLALGSQLLVFEEILKRMSKFRKWLAISINSFCLLIVVYTTYQNIAFSRSKLFAVLGKLGSI